VDAAERGRTVANLTLLGITGSLRERSYNAALLEAAAGLLPDDVELERFDIGTLPYYDADVEAEGDPEPVADLKRRIDAADGVLIATPEYMHGIPGVLKNALDWASRPPGRSPLKGKPVAAVGASPSPVGTARAQLQLRQTLVYVEADLVTKPEVLVASAGDRFDEDGELTDEDARKFLGRLLDRFVEHVRGRSARPTS
jgi:chromate reductase, NAD(P)H dehydrogenase (quinone)